MRCNVQRQLYQPAINHCACDSCNTVQISIMEMLIVSSTWRRHALGLLVQLLSALPVLDAIQASERETLLVFLLTAHFLGSKRAPCLCETHLRYTIIFFVVICCSLWITNTLSLFFCSLFVSRNGEAGHLDSR